MRKLYLLLALILFNLSLMSCSAEDDNEILDQSSSTENIKINYVQMDYEIVELINAHRISIGLNTINLLDPASKEAISHNQYMIEQGRISHDNFGSRAQVLMNEANAKKVSENVGYGYSSAQAVVEAWLNSEGHKKNIEDAAITHIGISSKTNSEGKYYYTNIFVKL